MLRIVLAYSTPSLNEDPAVVYCGCDGDAAEKAIAKIDPALRIEVANTPTLVRRRGNSAVVETEAKKKGK
jgi:hypothetical protein